MAQERQELTQSSAVRQLWEVTRPNNPNHAALYLELLQKTVEIPKHERFEEPFLRPKKSGGSRKIVPAQEPLRTVQYLMSRWICDNLPQGGDYCYTGLGVKRALQAHQENSYALVCDLCVSTAYAYNVVVAEMDRHLDKVLRQIGKTSTVEKIMGTAYGGLSRRGETVLMVFEK